MADLVESARGILSQSERRIEATANNVANITTSGFKAKRLYSEVSAATELRAPETLLREHLDLAQGRFAKTNNPLDLAISGAGMFRLRGSDGSIGYSRSGQFRLMNGGLVVDPNGFALQTSDGSDLVLPHDQVKVLADGTVLDGDRPIARIGIYEPAAGIEVRALGSTLIQVPEDFVEEVASPELRQGVLEGSNVALANEMVSMMEATRQAEGGARLIQTYDELMGRAISTLSQGAR